MLQGKVSQALKLVDRNSGITGLCNGSDEVIEKLRDLHPPAAPLNEDYVIDGIPMKVEPVIFEEISANLVVDVAKQLSGSGGPTQMDSDGWKHILCKYVINLTPKSQVICAKPLQT